MSFGFKYGVPHSNYYFDVGFLRNPARDKWGFFDKPDGEMRKYVLDQEFAQELLSKVEPLILFLSTVDQHQVFAFGCNAGRHRSTIIVDEMARRLEKKKINVEVIHRDR